MQSANHTDEMVSSKRAFLVCLSLIATVFSIYSYVWHCEFISFDDVNHIVENPAVSGGLTVAGVKAAFTEFHAGQWIPLSWVSHMIDVSLFGMDAGAHHLVAVGFHAVNACLLLWALSALTRQFWPSAIVAFIFAVHPLNVESVAWVAERKNVLSTMFWLLALVAYARHARVRSVGSMALVAVCMALGLMCKGMLVTLPFLLMLLDFWPLKRWQNESWRRLVLEKLPLFALAIGMSMITSRAAVSADALVPLSLTPISYRIANALANYGIYAGKLLFPIDLAIYYPLPVSAPYAMAVISGFLIVLLLVMAWRFRLEAPFFLVGLLWFLGVLVPVSGLVQVGKNVLADRFTYVPQIGFFIMIVWGVAHIARARATLMRPALGVAAAFVLMFAVRSSQYVRHWKDSASIFVEAAEATDENALAHANAGFALAKKGALQAAIAHYRECLKIAPTDVGVRSNLGAALSRAGKTDAALAEFRQALKDDPQHFESLLNLATQSIKSGQAEEAIRQLTPLLNRKEDPYLVNYWLGRAWQDAGNSERASSYYLAALQLRPGDGRATAALKDLSVRRPTTKAEGL